MLNWRTSGGVFELTNREREIIELEKQASAPHFWNDQEGAQRAMRRIASLREQLDALQIKGRFRLSQAVYDEALRAVEEWMP